MIHDHDHEKATHPNAGADPENETAVERDHADAMADNETGQVERDHAHEKSAVDEDKRDAHESAMVHTDESMVDVDKRDHVDAMDHMEEDHNESESVVDVDERDHAEAMAVHEADHNESESAVDVDERDHVADATADHEADHESTRVPLRVRAQWTRMRGITRMLTRAQWITRTRAQWMWMRDHVDAADHEADHESTRDHAEADHNKSASD